MAVLIIPHSILMNCSLNFVSPLIISAFDFKLKREEGFFYKCQHTMEVETIKRIYKSVVLKKLNTSIVKDSVTQRFRQ
jgi:hypothetical protein